MTQKTFKAKQKLKHRELIYCREYNNKKKSKTRFFFAKEKKNKNKTVLLMSDIPTK